MCARSTPSDPNIAIRITAPETVVQLFRRLLCTTRLAVERETGRLPSEAEAFEALLEHALYAWNVQDPLLRRRARRVEAVFERDGWRCTVPGCSSRRNLHQHHIVFRSAGGGDEPANLTTLCAFHHLRGVHDGRVSISGEAPDALCFELGTREGHPPLARFHSSDRVAYAVAT